MSDGELNGAWGMSFGPDGAFYVGSVETKQVLKYDASGNFLEHFAEKSGLINPRSLAFGPDNFIYAV